MIAAYAEHVVPFHDCDMMGIVWHGNYFKYFELARSVFQRKVGLDWGDLEACGLSMPVARTEADYKLPLVYGQGIRIAARCADPFRPTLDLSYEITDAAGIKLHARGVTRQVYVHRAAQEVLFALPAPVEERLRRALKGVSLP